VRENRRDLYIPSKMTSDNHDWRKAWFYLPNDDGRLSAYFGKVLTDKLDAWGYEVSPLERQAKLEVFTKALKSLVRRGLTAAAVVANFHRQRVLPLMERRLAIYQLTPQAASDG